MSLAEQRQKANETAMEILACRDILYTVPEAAKLLRVNKNMVYDLIHAKLLRAVKLGSLKVSTFAVEEFIRDMDAGIIEYDHVTKKATRHRSKSKAKSETSQNR